MSNHTHRFSLPWLFLILAAPLCGLNATPEPGPAESTLSSTVSGNPAANALRLAAQGAIEGRVYRHEDGAPISSGGIDVFSSAGINVASGSIVNGTYRVTGLIPGTYYVGTRNQGDRVGHVYRDLVCPTTPNDFNPRCSVSQGTPVEVTGGTTVGGIDLSLRKGATVEGRVISKGTQSPLAATVTVYSNIYPQWSKSATTDADGNFRITGLGPGEVYVFAQSPEAATQVYRLVDCPDTSTCLARGQKLNLQLGGLQTGIDFELVENSSLGSLSARVLSKATGQPLACKARAFLADKPERLISSAECQADGTLIIKNLDSGFYYLYVEGQHPSTSPYLYGRGSCNTLAATGLCDLRRGTLIEVTSGQTRELFDTIQLEESGNIQLQVNLNGSITPTGKVALYEGMDQLSSESITTSGRTYFYSRLRPGRYQLAAEGAPYWQSAAVPERPCSRWYCGPEQSGGFEVRAGETTEMSMSLQPLYQYSGCSASEENLCLNYGRFQVRAFWKDFLGQTGQGIARRLTDETGYFYFFSANNVEVMVKLLNGCSHELGHRFWAFAAGLTNVEVELEVTDTLTGNVERYRNGLGQAYQPILDINAFATCGAEENNHTSQLMADFADLYPPAVAGVPSEPESSPADSSATCAASGNEFCVGGKFKVSVAWRTLNGESGSGTGFAITEDTAGVSFFSQSNVELMIKILDACQTSAPRHWVFVSGLTDVEIDLRIEDIETGAVKVYHQPAGPFQPIIDLGTFACN